MPKWIAIDSIKTITLYNQIPSEYLLEKGFSNEDIINDINYELLDSWGSNYLKEKKEGMVIYILDDNYTSPSRNLYQKNILKTFNTDSLSNFKTYTPERYKVWQEVRNHTKNIMELFFRKIMPVDINKIGSFYQEWKVVDMVTEDVCEKCSEIVVKGSLIEYNDNEICESCKLSYQKAKAFNFGYTYFVKESQTGLTKIGKAIDVEKRFQSLKVGIPFDIELIHKIQSNDYHLCEKRFHDYFNKKKVKGEWYNLSNEEVEWVKKMNVENDLYKLIAK